MKFWNGLVSLGLLSIATLVATVAHAGECTLGNAKLLLEGYPPSTNAYNDTPADLSFFRVSELMEACSLTRLQSAKLQARFRGLARDGKTPWGDAFQMALESVRADSERALKEKLEEARFIVVLDLDETAYDQSKATKECHSYSVSLPGKAEKYIHLAPGINELLKGVHELGGTSLFFTASLEPRARSNLSQWKLDGTPILETGYVAGLFAHGHMHRFDKLDREGVVLQPSKDLRIFDGQLRKTILVDDNPVRVLQHRNLRLTKKFFADQYCAKAGPMRTAFDRQLPAILEEIRDSVNYLEKNAASAVGFAQAYLPYTMLGRISATWLEETGSVPAKARDFVRAHPETVDQKF